jgi:hypothetical protein
MAGIRLFIIRLVSTVLIIIACFMFGWYLYSRYSQLNSPGSVVREDEINNPRLNYNLLERLSNEFEDRTYYSQDYGVSVEVSEADPFYE